MTSRTDKTRSIADPVGLAIAHIAGFVTAETGHVLNEHQSASLYRAENVVIWISRAIEAHLDKERAHARRVAAELHKLADDGCPNVGEH